MGLRIVLVAFAMGSPLAFGLATSANYLDMDLRQDRYLGDVQHSTQRSNYSALGLVVNFEDSILKKSYAKLNVHALGTFEVRDETYFGIPEAYAETTLLGPRITMGRKKRNWSRLDEDFHLGLWQPELRWDYLAPVQQGLTGMFVEIPLASSWHITLFGSGVNIPDQGPQYRLENGQFYSSNRWFQQPTGGRVALFNETPFASEAPLYFRVDRPSDENLFLQPSLGLGINYDNDRGYWSHFSYAYKPRNQVHLGVECTNCANLGAVAPLEITAVIHGKIVRHHVATWEAGFDHVDDKAFVSLTGEFPDKSGFPAAYEEAALNNTFVAGAAYQRYIGTWLGKRPAWAQLAYFRVFDLQSRTGGGLLSEDNVRSSMDRYPLRNIAAFDLKIRLFDRGSFKMHWTNRYQYSIPEQGGWLSSKFDLSRGPMSFMLGADILGSYAEPNSADAGLFTRYRYNDRVVAGVSYVF